MHDQCTVVRLMIEVHAVIITDEKCPLFFTLTTQTVRHVHQRKLTGMQSQKRCKGHKARCMSDHES